jgi:hypothetical protein
LAVLLDFEFIRIIFISSWPLFRVSDQKTKWKQNTLWFYYEYSFFLSFFPHRGKSEYFPIPFYDLVSLCATCRTTITKEEKNWGKKNIGPQVEPTLFLSLFLDCQKPFFVSTTSSVSPYVETQIIYSKAISVTLNDFLCFLDKWT